MQSIPLRTHTFITKQSVRTVIRLLGLLSCRWFAGLVYCFTRYFQRGVVDCFELVATFLAASNVPLRSADVVNTVRQEFGMNRL
jgi:hypothetical protein